MIDDTAKAILALPDRIGDIRVLRLAANGLVDLEGNPHAFLGLPALQAMAKLWLMRDEIREVADDALMFAETEGFENEEALARALLAKLDAA